MVGKAAAAKLASYERRYRDLAGQLAGIGYIASGSLAQRHTRCGKPTCACHADPSRRHGPYWHWTAKVDGKTVNKRLTEREASLYREWIANDRKARSLLAQMRAIAAEAETLILAQDTEQPRARGRRRSSETAHSDRTGPPKTPGSQSLPAPSATSPACLRLFEA